MVRSFGFKKFMMTILARKIRSFGWPPTVSHKKCHRTRHYVAVVAGQKARNQKRYRRVRRIAAGSELWSTRARMFRLKNLWGNKKFWMGVFRTEEVSC